MPGHKGKPVLPELNHPFAIDYTEIEGTGNLYAGDEPILSAERAAARYYGAADCLFLTGGSTQALMTAIAAAVPAGGTLLVDRNCHKAVTHAMALLDLTPEFIVPHPLDETGLPGRIDAQEVEDVFARAPQAAALLVTSPNYYGVMQEIPALAELCHAHGVPLLVDAAHGAHFPAVGVPSAIEQGADLAAVSTHKTLPALGQSASLLSSGVSRLIRCWRPRRCLAPPARRMSCSPPLTSRARGWKARARRLMHGARSASRRCGGRLIEPRCFPR